MAQGDKVVTLDGLREVYRNLNGNVSDLKSAVTEITGNTVIPLVSGKYVKLSGETVTMSDGYPAYSAGATSYACGIVACTAGDTFEISGHGGGDTRLWGFVDASGNVLTVSSANITENGIIITAPTNAAFLITHTNNGSTSFVGTSINTRTTDNEKSIGNIDSKIGAKTKEFDVASGSTHSSNVENDKIYIDGFNKSSLYISVKSTNNVSRTVQAYVFKTDGTSVASTSFYTNGEYVGLTVDADAIAIGVTIGNPTESSKDTFVFTVADVYGLAIANTKNVFNVIRNARHIKGDAAEPLTLLHISDLHGDANTLNRIVNATKILGNNIDDAICTGDMCANVGGAISTWWVENVMTCVGNHDTATYNSETGYDWTALSMADRDAYYIAPFESNWNVTHTSGTSYYYKDYDTQKVRLIVMDAMLYMGTPGAEATAQTEWLTNLLDDAITHELHTIIAIHAPHGGAEPKECSFSRYGQTAMPTQIDCNTPQTIIDAVDDAITDGLHFVGYLVGHTHQDNIWDAENDGKQLMYCITCAGVSRGLWINSDQTRSAIADAFNLVTIDTANTLVKIIRGGGADIDDHMRTRKAICINYSTGEIVGEVL